MPHIPDPWVFDQAQHTLHELFGLNAQFRPGQYEAIEATLSNRRTLVVQRTGWGKSLVYFVVTRIQRQLGLGVTLVISPLISLMDNQIKAARSMGLVCEVLNSSVEKERRPQILDDVRAGVVDLLFTTPETLFATDMQQALPHMRIGLFVIDEAHCISDWGHDFRLEYTRLRSVLPNLDGVPLLATTATATDAVIDDICLQLGGDVYVSRGPLVRDSLSIEVVRATNAVEKYAWLLANLRQMPGSGLIYCTTTHDCDRVAQLLEENGMPARSYHSKRDPEERTQTLRLFDQNRIKALVATSAVGMGYDKDDIAFVVHFQLPSGIVDYYQQIGRAGRKLDRAYAILLYGDESDLRIQEYFIASAFPTEDETRRVAHIIASTPGGVRFMDLLNELNMRRVRLNKALDFLQNDGFVVKDGPRYRATERPFAYNSAHYEAITARRHAELQGMVDFAEGHTCSSQAVVQALGDTLAPVCGHCANCLGGHVFAMREPSDHDRHVASEFVDRDHLAIVPRKRWPSRDLVGGSVVIREPNEESMCLARLGWGRLGGLVAQALDANASFDDALVQQGARTLAPCVRTQGIVAVVPVPSLTRSAVRDYAARLAWQLGLPLVDALAKNPVPPQFTQENSYFQCKNALAGYQPAQHVRLSGPVLLVDDLVDSKWTLTVCGSLLRGMGATSVHPFVLANAERG